METKYLTCAETAKLIRPALKAAFPGVKFSVRSETYSGGASIDVSWTDGPTGNAVDAILNRFQNCDFDGMQDMKVYRADSTVTIDGQEQRVHFGANFVFSHRELSEDYLTELQPVAEKILGRPMARAVYVDDTWTEWGAFRGGSAHNFLHYLSQYVAPSTYASS